MDTNTCYCVCELKNYTKAESTGLRSTFFYPGGGTYKGYWLRSKHNGFGEKLNKSNLVYNGFWNINRRDGFGTMRLLKPNGTYNLTYSGQWQHDMKNGEGKQFYKDGVFYGCWKNNRRHGFGIHWYKNGNLYMGEWKADVYHGLGVFFYTNGNRYEGHFARGFKNGEGTFYHMHTGQVQKGMWENDMCKTSLVQDEFRNQAKHSTQYPIPPVLIANAEKYVHEFFQKYMPNANKAVKSFNELVCLKFVRKIRQFAKFQPRHVSNSRIPLIGIKYPCTCIKPEKILSLHFL